MREIRKLESSGELPNRNRVIALTGNARAGQVQSARDAGMDDVIVRTVLGECGKYLRVFLDQTVQVRRTINHH